MTWITDTPIPGIFMFSEKRKTIYQSLLYTFPKKVKEHVGIALFPT